MESTTNKLTFTTEDGTQKDDLLDLNNFLDEFDNTIKTLNYKVYGLTGDWGIGKSSFINIWENFRLKQNEYIHINAFEKDYESNAFVVLFAEIYKHLQKIKKVDKQELKNFFENGKRYLSHIAKASLKLGVNVLLDKTIGSENIKEFSNALIDDYCNDILEKATRDENIHDKLVEVLNEITNKMEFPLYIIIDELDRCRPSFALEMLEKVKHIFSVKNIKFILVYNPEIFKNMIEKEYGLKDNGDRYLNKFIEKDIKLTYKTDIKEWLRSEIQDITKEEFNSNNAKIEVSSLVTNLLTIKDLYNISLREFSKILTEIKNYKLQAFFSIIVSVEILRFVNRYELYEIINYAKHNEHLADNHPPKTYIDIMKVLATDKVPHWYDMQIQEFKRIFPQLVAEGIIK